MSENEKTLADEMLSEMSPPSEQVDEILAELDASNVAVDAPATVSPPIADFTPKEAPATFDPSIHVIDSAGRPVLNRDGSYKRKPGRKKGQRNGTGIGSISESVSDNGNVAVQLDPNIQAHTTAKQVAFLTVACGILLFGDEWKPEADEMPMMETAWLDYFRVAPLNMPVWLTPIIVTGMYASKRIGKPKTQTRLEKIGSAFKRAWYWMLGSVGL